MAWRALQQVNPRYGVAGLALITRVISVILLALLRNFPQFDSSARILTGGSASLRWDAIHFVSIAMRGYEYDQQTAFQPGWPLLMRWVFSLCDKPSWIQIEVLGQVMATASYIGAAVLFYELSSTLFDKSFALSATMLYLLPPTPAVLSSPYTEPLFAMFTFAGFLLAARRRYLLAAYSLAASAGVRATGILVAGPLAWMIVFRSPNYAREVSLRRITACILPCVVVILPFVATQAYFYWAMCRGTNAAIWCRRRLPLLYSHVQEKYWNVGLLNYWTIEQIPNLVLASPILALSFTGVVRFWRRKAFPHPSASRYLLLPLYLHHLGLCLLLTFSAHSQIALRSCAADPVFWWSLAGMAYDWKGGGLTSIGSCWVWFTVLFGAASIVLWAGHYPPA